MDAGDASSRPGPCLIELRIADDPEAWTAAGFRVEGDIARIGQMDLRLTGARPEGERRGIVGWTLAGVDVPTGELDGLPTSGRSAASPPVPPPAEPHPNGVVGMDHVVVLTPDLDRTIDACIAAGLDLRRIREGPTGSGADLTQAFFRLGSTILEVVSANDRVGTSAAVAPASWFGLAVDVDDLDETAAVLGDGLGRIKGAVQPGRRIATLRHQQFGLSIAVAVMDHHGQR